MYKNSSWRCIKLKIGSVQLEFARFYLIRMQAGQAWQSCLGWNDYSYLGAQHSALRGPDAMKVVNARPWSSSLCQMS
jgi:hypothetical protein